MALHKKLQEVFNWYIDTIKNEVEPDLFDFSVQIEKKLEDMNIKINSAQFINQVFEALQYPSPSWKPNTKDLLIFFDSLPDRMLKDKWNILTDYVPKSEWGRYNKQWAKATSGFVTSLSKEPLILVEEDKSKNLIFSAFLGDIRGKLGISKKDLDLHYNDVYDAVENELGRTAIGKHLPENLKVIDWPNASTLANAKYQFKVHAQKDPALNDFYNAIIVAMNRIGF